MLYRPKLRADVEPRPAADPERIALYDALLDRAVTLPKSAAPVLERLDGARTLDDLGPRAEAEPVVRKLLLLNLLEGAGDQILARVRKLKSGEERPRFAVLEEGRFACLGTGDCCMSYNFGPLTDEDVARIEKLDVAGAFPHLPDGVFYDEKNLRATGGKAKFLKQVGERCTFLLPDNRCGIHAKFGAEAKPNLCRIYPYIPLFTLDGIKVYDNGKCSNFSITARSGLPVVQDIDRIAALMPAGLELYHPGVAVGEKLVFDFGYFLDLQHAWCDLVALGRGGALGTLLAIARLGREVFEALAACPLEAGEPEATAARAIATDPRLLYSGPQGGALTEPERARAAQGIAQAAGALLQALRARIAMAAPSPHDFLSDRQARELGQVLHIVHLVAANRADAAAQPLPDFYQQIAAVPADAPELDELFRLSFRQVLFGHRALIEDRPVPALLRLAMSYLVTVFGAKLRALMEGEPRVRAIDFNFGHKLANRIFRNPTIAPAFVALEGLAWGAIEAVPFVTGAAK